MIGCRYLIMVQGQNSEEHQLLVYMDVKEWMWKSGIYVNFVLFVSEDTNHSWAVSLIHIDVSLDANMMWLIVSKAAERSSNMINEPYLYKAVLCYLSSMCVMAVSVLLKDVYVLWKIFSKLYLWMYALSCLATTLSRVLDRVNKRLGDSFVEGFYKD